MSWLPALLVLFVLGKAQDNSDAYLNTPQLIEKYGYAVEQHEVTSQNGYLLTLFRIGPGENCTSSGEPVLLHHGLGSDSDVWLLQGTKSLAFLLADDCYDVWVVNGRGNKYSRRHRTLDTNKSAFWDFSWHEQGVHDLPATIDYICNVTGESSLSYTGHSMGTTIFLVMASERPEYVQKVRLAFLLAPAAYTSNIPNVFVRLLAPVIVPLADPLFILLHGEVPSSSQPTPGSDMSPPQTLNAIASIFQGGQNPREVNVSRNATQSLRANSGASVYQLVHYLQEVLSGCFCQYDHGLLRNLKKYGRISPPAYKLGKINCSVFAIYSKDDSIVGVKDVKRLSEATPPNFLFYLVPEEGFDHGDFLIGENASSLIYVRILVALKSGSFPVASKDVRATVSPESRQSAPSGRLQTRRGRPAGSGWGRRQLPRPAARRGAGRARSDASRLG